MLVMMSSRHNGSQFLNEFTDRGEMSCHLEDDILFGANGFMGKKNRPVVRGNHMFRMFTSLRILSHCHPSAIRASNTDSLSPGRTWKL